MSPAPVSTSDARRAVCPRCTRPETVCYCHALTTIETRSRILILQHPREEGMPIGTAHMAHLCLPQSSVHVGVRWDDSDVLRQACADPQRPPVLLYPGPDAPDVLREPPEGPVTLVVVDGTWSQARTILRDNPQLAALPRYALEPPEPSNYRIRREPRASYVSTLEALMHALGAIEGDPARFRDLVRPMDAMVDAQLAAQAAARTTGAPTRMPRRRRRRSPWDRLPEAIRQSDERLVLVYGEANAWPHGSTERARGDELVHWTALRPATGATFSRVVAPRHPLAPDIPQHVELSASRLRAGGGVSDLLAAFASFSRPDDVLASWGYHAVRLWQDCGGSAPTAYLDLQTTARVLTNRRPGSLEAHARSLGLAPRLGHPEGRAGRRLGLLASLVDGWRASGGEREPTPGD